MTSDLTIALVGATGAVGMQFLRIIEERGLAVKELRPLATKRSAGTTVRFRGEDLIVEETSHESFNNADVAFISATTAASEELCPIAREKVLLFLTIHLRGVSIPMCHWLLRK